MARADESSPNGYCIWRFVDGDWVAENHCTAGNQCAAKQQKQAAGAQPRMSDAEFRALASHLRIAVADRQGQVTVPCVPS